VNFRNRQSFLPSELTNHHSNSNPIKEKQMGKEFKQLFQFNDGTSEVFWIILEIFTTKFKRMFVKK